MPTSGPHPSSPPLLLWHISARLGLEVDQRSIPNDDLMIDTRTNPRLYCGTVPGLTPHTIDGESPSTGPQRGRDTHSRAASSRCKRQRRTSRRSEQTGDERVPEGAGASDFRTLRCSSQAPEGPPRFGRLGDLQSWSYLLILLMCCR